jgi:hypothetical protein
MTVHNRIVLVFRWTVHDKIYIWLEPRVEPLYPGQAEQIYIS